MLSFEPPLSDVFFNNLINFFFRTFREIMMRLSICILQTLLIKVVPV